MTCYSPLKGYRSIEKTVNGKYKIVFNKKDAYGDLKVTVPCGQCLGCRIDRSKAWALRCMHEVSLNSDNCFITLTYDDNHLPSGNTLVKADFQKFMKRVRKNNPDKKIRYFHCGEYGDNSGRPHYHAIVFGHDFRDTINYLGERDSISDELSKLWDKGIHFVGDANYDSARYVASYIFKKVTGEKALSHYKEIGVNKSTGEVLFQLPEYVTMSKGKNGSGGIGKEWIDTYGNEVYNVDTVILKGREVKPPKYYDRLLERKDNEKYRDVKLKRMSKMKDLSYMQLRAKEKTQRAKMSLKERTV